MNVRSVMRRAPRTCRINTNLAAVAEQIWSGGCGALPMVDASDKVVGIIRDRDICVALGARNVRPCDLIAEQVMSREVAICKSSDDIRAALRIMRTRKVRRIPVTDNNEKLEGILCLSDLILQARHDDGCSPELSYEDVMNALKAIYWKHSVELSIQSSVSALDGSLPLRIGVMSVLPSILCVLKN